jgi:hypothetical protein
MELEQPEAVPTPVEAKPAPSFAKLTHLSDGTPLNDSESHAEDADVPKKTEDEESETDAKQDKPARRRNASHEPDYNPWGN